MIKRMSLMISLLLVAAFAGGCSYEAAATVRAAWTP